MTLIDTMYIICILFPSSPKNRLAAELAAKKTRVKQSLIKRARSVAIFSLKLKERRAREAEKQAFNLAEQEKVNTGNPLNKTVYRSMSKLN